MRIISFVVLSLISNIVSSTDCPIYNSRHWCKRMKCRWRRGRCETPKNFATSSPTPSKEICPNHERYTFVDKLFNKHEGMHLQEANQIIGTFYKQTVQECAERCLVSPIYTGKRCLSFDFYPYNDCDSGICVLNQNTFDTAYLRFNDQGITDIDILRDFFESVAGMEIATDAMHNAYFEAKNHKATNYLGSQGYFTRDEFKHLWPGSRWGCGKTVFQTSDELSFKCGFTPVDNTGNCPPRMNYINAVMLCVNRGGRLCADKEELEFTRDSGCGFDDLKNWEKATWHAGYTDGFSDLKLVRCCSDYTYNAYCPTIEQIQTCSKISKKPKCRVTGFEIGLGRNIDKINDGYWTDNTGQHIIPDPKYGCLWCGVHNTGTCYPGNVAGICPSSNSEQREMWKSILNNCKDEPNWENTEALLYETYPELLT